METALYVFAAWFGLGAIGTVVLLGARTSIRRSRERQDWPLAAAGIVARAGQRDIDRARVPATNKTALTIVLALADDRPQDTNR
jgi:hypothetical protein